MRLNLGCGEQYAEGWINVDRDDTPHRKDLAVDLTDDLPWDDESVERVYAGHLLEHLTLDQCHYLLTSLYPCMKRSGIIMIVGPDVELAEQLQGNGYVLEVPLDQLKKGAGRWAGDVHQWECTRGKLVELVQDAGWSDVTPLLIDQVGSEWPVAFRGPQWQVAVSAVAL